MGVREKYVIYNLLYMRMAGTAFGKGLDHIMLPHIIHREAMRKTNFILAAIGETFTDEDAFMAICRPVQVEES